MALSNAHFPEGVASLTVEQIARQISKHEEVNYLAVKGEQTPKSKKAEDRISNASWSREILVRGFYEDSARPIRVSLHWMNFYSRKLVDFIGSDRMYRIKGDASLFEENENGIFIKAVDEYDYFRPGDEEKILFLQDKLRLSDLTNR